MKFAVAFAVLAVASQCLAAPSANDEYKDLILDILKFAKQQLTEQDPFVFPDVKGQKIKTQDLDLTLDQSNTKLSKASTFTVEDVETDPATLTAFFKVHIPELVQTFDFSVDGTGFGKKVSGSGSASVQIVDFYQSAKVTFENPDTSLQIKDLVLNYDIKSLVVDESGLKIEGFTDAQVKELVSAKFVEYVKTNKAAVEAATAKAMAMNFNKNAAGKTLKEVAAYIRSLIHN